MIIWSRFRGLRKPKCRVRGAHTLCVVVIIAMNHTDRAFCGHRVCTSSRPCVMRKLMDIELRHEENRWRYLESLPPVCPHPGCQKDRCLIEGAMKLFGQQKVPRGNGGLMSVMKDIIKHRKNVEACRCKFPGCGMSFSHRQNLRRHVDAVHLEKKDFACDFPVCGYKTGRAGNLKKHAGLVHSGEANQRKKKEEQKVANALDAAGIAYKREHQVNFGCWADSYARADFLVQERGGVLLVEADERQHEDYGVACDVVRMTKIHTAFAVEGNTLPVGVIRYNPHAFRVDGRLRRVSTADRLARLVDVIKTWDFGPEGSLQIQYMYYDCHTVARIDPCLTIWSDAEYNSEVRSCCKIPIT